MLGLRLRVHDVLRFSTKNSMNDRIISIFRRSSRALCRSSDSLQDMASQPIGTLRQRRRQNLDCDLAHQLGVARPVDFTPAVLPMGARTSYRPNFVPTDSSIRRTLLSLADQKADCARMTRHFHEKAGAVNCFFAVHQSPRDVPAGAARRKSKSAGTERSRQGRASARRSESSPASTVLASPLRSTGGGAGTASRW